MILRERVSAKLDELECDLIADKHRSKNDDDIREVVELLFSIKKFHRILNEEERDFLTCAMLALENQKPWNKDEQNEP